MEVQVLTPEAWSKQRRIFLGFAVRFGDKRITAASLHAMRRLEASALAEDECGIGTSAAICALLGGKLAGIAVAVRGGEDGCIVAVHPGARKRGVGFALMKALAERMNGLVCHVATDNTASLSICFRLGMKAVSMHKGPTGKPTLRFERRIHHDSARSGHTDSLSQ